MREIIFKAKRKCWRELPKEEWWVEGNLITNEREEGTAYIGYIFDVHNGVIEDFDIVEIDPETLCQCTGLKDRKGNEIWENDILRNKGHGNPLIVKWNTLYGRYDTVLPSYSPHDPIIASFSLGKWEPLVVDHSNEKLKEYKLANDYEVVGNIFDNREIVYDEYDDESTEGVIKINDLAEGKYYLLEDLSGEMKKVFVEFLFKRYGEFYRIHFVDEDSVYDVSADVCKHMVFHDIKD